MCVLPGEKYENVVTVPKSNPQRGTDTRSRCVTRADAKQRGTLNEQYLNYDYTHKKKSFIRKKSVPVF